MNQNIFSSFWGIFKWVSKKYFEAVGSFDKLLPFSIAVTFSLSPLDLKKNFHFVNIHCFIISQSSSSISKTNGSNSELKSAVIWMKREAGTLIFYKNLVKRLNDVVRVHILLELAEKFLTKSRGSTKLHSRMFQTIFFRSSLLDKIWMILSIEIHCFLNR